MEVRVGVGLTWCRRLTGNGRLIRGLDDLCSDLEGAAALLPISVQSNHHNVLVGLSVGAQYHTCHHAYLHHDIVYMYQH